ncbi:MAG: cobyrinate a,c-diamide synthase [Desulfovibrio aminophilus]|jgi:cobyrinic acid a,c-diamide synthase|uniref:cobyrinate a,c-diamide synthase n=1 Tax=Desulfovibrio aminophilus TaxID=81425 RepID=UPI00042943C5|nr:cobyrinate a,c-diamide synthase [Desulfovibrio aminophilus]
MPAPKACVIAGTHSGCGKTSVTLGLMTAFARRGLRVAPFKAGPDFIDPGLHARAAGRHSHNLDSWMLPPKAVRDLFARHAGEADLALVEGVMGLFDGLSPTENTGSTAELAALLDLPVILVADARSLARSAAALVQGYVRFDPALRFAGVILDRVGSTSHADTLRKALEAHLPGPPLLGCLPRDDSLALPARHLGLVTAEDAAGLDELLGRLADACERHLDLDALLAALPAVAPAAPDDPPPPGTRARIGLARDRAFCFVYEENLRLLRDAGAEIAPFSPLADKHLPPDLDGLYLPGGYPELAAFDLAQNASLRKEILAFSRSGRPVYAECGGLLYLLDRISVEGRTFPMCGAFPFRAELKPRLAALGYRQVTTTRPTLLGPAGTTLRGHEFHYTALEPAPGTPDTAYAVSGRDGPRPAEGFCHENTLASYIHLHFGSCPEAARAFVEACAARR